MKKLSLYLLLFTSSGSYAQTIDYSMEFDGVDDYIEVPSSPSLSPTPLTITCWIRATDASSDIPRGIVSKENNNINSQREFDFLFREDLSNVLDFTIFDGTGSVYSFYSNTSLIFDQWYFLAAVYDGTTMKMYIDGIEDPNSLTVSTSILLGSNPLRIGVQGSDLSRVFNGWIDKVAIWNIALTQQDIQDLMSCGPSGSESDLAAYLNFISGIGATAFDNTVNSNDGTLINGPNWSTVLPPNNCCTANPFTSQPTDQTVNMGNDATFSFTDSLSFAFYQWQMDAGTGYTNLSNAGQFSGTDTKTLTVSAVTMSNNNTNYRCLVTESSSCSDTTDVANLTVLSGNSINEYDNAAVKIYPNPTNGWFTLSLSNTTSGRVILTDLLGKEVLIKSFTSNEVQLNLKSLEATGTYFAKVLDADGNVIAIRKLIYQ